MQQAKKATLLLSIWSWYLTTICIIVIMIWSTSDVFASDQFCSHSGAWQLRFIIWIQKCYHRHKTGENEDTCISWKLWLPLMLNISATTTWQSTSSCLGNQTCFLLLITPLLYYPLTLLPLLPKKKQLRKLTQLLEYQ